MVRVADMLPPQLRVYARNLLLRAPARKCYPGEVPEDIDVSAWRAVLLAQSRALRAIERDMEAAGTIPLNWYDVLLELNSAPERRLRMQDLAARAVLSRTRVSRVVAELEAEGYVERRADPDDGRASLATITPAGRAVLRQTAPVYLAGIDTHFNRHVSASAQRAIAAALQRVIDAHQAQLDLRR
jgi:DNA-binding MarR family transcriptional regulator